MFASAAEMEPNMWFRAYRGADAMQWLGCEPVVSRFAGKRRVRVLCSPGPAFVTDVEEKFQVVESWEARRD